MSGQQAARWALVCSVLDAVLDAPENERQRVLDERCQGDPGLREEVAALLQADTALDDKLETPLLERAGALFDGDDAPAESFDPPPGETIGPWRLIEELGRGGMGTVWLAERADGAFEHRVALKLLKRGLDSDAILERFLAERQILARLQHPHIAHLIDGGVAVDGRPYFAMERVEGEPITRWCDARRLPVRERLELFLAVADAVQYAHRQLVVHRDLKPSNILVTQQGEAKLLDFGIAKLLDADADRAEVQTLTQLGIRMLTPEYAAPEQLRGDAVTTATDVYALGVLLYELLSGQRPPPAEADPAADKLPPRPSTKITDDAAEARGTTRERLRRALRGDLDTIVLRAMHPAPERRYGSAEALGADIRRHLDRLPVEARPDSFRYRVGKFIARNRLAVAAAALVALTLIAGIVAIAWQAREARQQAKRAEQVKDFLVTVFEAGSPQEWRGKEPTARDLLDAGAKRVDEELIGDPALHAEMLAVIGSLQTDLSNFERARVLVKRSLEARRALFGESHEEYADSLGRWAQMLYRMSDWRAAEPAATRTVEIYRRTLGDHPRTASALGTLSAIRFAMSDVDGAITLRQQALDIDRRTLGSMHPSVAEDLRFLGLLLVERERYDEAGPLLDEALRVYQRLYGVGSVRYAMALNRKGNLLHYQGELQHAANGYRQAAATFAKAGDINNQQRALQDLGIVLCRMGRFNEAERALRQSLSLLEQDQSIESQFIALRRVSIGSCLVKARRYAEGNELLRNGVSAVERKVGATHAWTSFALRAYAEALNEQRRYTEALPLIERALSQYQRKFGPGSARTADSLRVLGRAQAGTNDIAGGLASAQKALVINSRIHGQLHPSTALTNLTVAELELQAGNTDAAARRLRETLPILEKSGDLPEAERVLTLLGSALMRLHQNEDAEQAMQRATAISRSLYGDKPDGMATPTRNLSTGPGGDAPLRNQ